MDTVVKRNTQVHCAAGADHTFLHDVRASGPAGTNGTRTKKPAAIRHFGTTVGYPKRYLRSPASRRRRRRRRADTGPITGGGRDFYHAVTFGHRRWRHARTAVREIVLSFYPVPGRWRPLAWR